MTLPTGTITFLFTDIEGSTRLWEQHPEQMQQAHARHGELIVSCVEQHGGQFVRTRGEGDSTFSVFSIAADALAAVCAFQLALAAEPWPAETPIWVRAALHTGTAKLRDEDYNSSDVNRCARLRAIAHGGQTLLSQSAYELCVDNLPEGVWIKDMGLHRLKDLSRPEHVWQLCHLDLPADFPPLTSLTPMLTNLPMQLTSFIGREREMEQVKRLLSRRRLLTLTGMGGCGKTRLALQVGADVIEDYPDGVWLVELAPLSDSALVAQTIASVLEIREQPGKSMMQSLVDALKSKKLLLVLDNCEHLIAACARLADSIILSCPQVHLLVTSREPLRIKGEQIYPIPSLLSPDASDISGEEKDWVKIVAESEAARLFIERAELHQPDFGLTSQNATTVASICQRLDGIPLALELAAARVRALSVEEINARLDNRFRLLTTGSRTVQPRQQTLQALIDWSYDLLTKPEQTLFSRLSVFSGGWTLDAAEQVCSAAGVQVFRSSGVQEKPMPTLGEELQSDVESGASEPEYLNTDEVLDLLTSLVDKSLVMYEEQQEGRGRYRMLETVRQYALDRLIQSEEADRVRSQHRDYFLQFAEEAQPKLAGPEQMEWLERLDAEHANLRAALEWSLEKPGVGGRVSGVVLEEERERGRGGEGEQKPGTGPREQAIDNPNTDTRLFRHPTPDTRHPSKAGLRLASTLQQFWWTRGYLAEGRSYCVAALAQEGASERTTTRANVLNGAGILARMQGDYASARAFHEESLAIRRELHDEQGVAGALHNLSAVVQEQGDYTTARALLEEALAINRAIGNRAWEANNLNNLGNVADEQGDFATARAYWESALALYRTLGNRQGTALALGNLANAWAKSMDFPKARALQEEALALRQELGDRWGMALSLKNLGRIAIEQGDLRSAHVFQTESLRLQQQLGNLPGVVMALEGFALTAQAQSQPRRSARLLSAASALRESINYPLPPGERMEYDRHVAEVEREVGAERFAAETAAGRVMSLEQAIEYALAEETE